MQSAALIFNPVSGQRPAARQAKLEAVASERRAPTEPMQERSRRLISQIKTFFKL